MNKSIEKFAFSAGYATVNAVAAAPILAITNPICANARVISLRKLYYHGSAGTYLEVLTGEKAPTDGSVKRPMACVKKQSIAISRAIIRTGDTADTLTLTEFDKLIGFGGVTLGENSASFEDDEIVIYPGHTIGFNLMNDSGSAINAKTSVIWQERIAESKPQEL